jgi:hypothetical protein
VAPIVAATALLGCGGGGGGGDTAASTSPTGFWDASANGVNLAMVVLPDATMWTLYAGNGVAGLLQGALNGTARDFAANNGFLTSPTELAVSGTAVTKTRIGGTLARGTNVVQYSGTYDRSYDALPAVAAIAAKYDGLGFSAGSSMTIAASGAVTGNVLQCNYTGSVTPRSTGNVFDLRITFASPGCALDGATLNGVAVPGTDDGTLFAAGLNELRNIGILFVGAK